MMKHVYIKHYKCLKTPTIKIVKSLRLNQNLHRIKKSEVNNSTTI